jgi:adenine phosphoribosyltransferase
MFRPFADQRIDKIVGIESRGFIFATAMAYKIGAGFVPIRKPGKLPATTIRQEYELEYGSDAVEIHVDAITPGEQVLLVDDLLATGGTAEASVAMLQRLEAKIIGLSFLIELDFLAGREKLSGQNVHAVLHY